MGFEILIIRNPKYNNPNLCFLDDFYPEKVDIKGFPFKEIFSDFRIFNGVQLKDMDTALVKIAQAFAEMNSKRAKAGG